MDNIKNQKKRIKAQLHSRYRMLNMFIFAQKSTKISIETQTLPAEEIPIYIFLRKSTKHSYINYVFHLQTVLKIN